MIRIFRYWGSPWRYFSRIIFCCFFFLGHWASSRPSQHWLIFEGVVFFNYGTSSRPLCNRFNFCYRIICLGHRSSSCSSCRLLFLGFACIGYWASWRSLRSNFVVWLILLHSYGTNSRFSGCGWNFNWRVFSLRRGSCRPGFGFIGAQSFFEFMVLFFESYGASTRFPGCIS